MSARAFTCVDWEPFCLGQAPKRLQLQLDGANYQWRPLIANCSFSPIMQFAYVAGFPMQTSLSLLKSIMAREPGGRCGDDPRVCLPMSMSSAASAIVQLGTCFSS